MANITQLPFNARLAYTLICISLSCALLYYAQGIILPVLMALLFAILLRPVAHFFKHRLHFPHVLASISAVILMCLIVLAIFAFISWQVSDIVSDWSKIKRNVTFHIRHLQDMIYHNFNLTRSEQTEMISDATKDSKKMVGSTLLSFSDMLLNLILIPVYTFLFLLYRTHFMQFLSKLVPESQQTVLEDILTRIKVSVQSYIVGLMIEMVLVSVLTSAGYMIIGLEYAILLGIITGILNLIPYVGITIAGVLAIVASLSTNTDVSLVFGVIIVNLVVQLIDNNLLVPMIVSSKVEINAFISIVGIIIGGALGGVSGMFLAIPFIAIMKVVFDRIKPLEPWGYLFGDDLPKTYQWHRIHLPRFDHEGFTGQTFTTAEKAVEPDDIFTETSTNDK